MFTMRKICIVLSLIIAILVMYFWITKTGPFPTTYQKVGYSGGYDSQKLSDDKYRVWFLYNGVIKLSKVERYLKYRCAEITIENEKRYFTILSQKETLVPLKLEYVIIISNSISDRNDQNFEAKQIIEAKLDSN